MPAFIAAIWGALLRIIPTIAGQVLIALGVSVVTYTGVDTSITWLVEQMQSKFALLPPEALGMMSTMKIGESISIVISAIAVRMAISGFTSGSFKRWTTK